MNTCSLTFLSRISLICYTVYSCGSTRHFHRFVDWIQGLIKKEDYFDFIEGHRITSVTFQCFSHSFPKPLLCFEHKYSILSEYFKKWWLENKGHKNIRQIVEKKLYYKKIYYIHMLCFKITIALLEKVGEHALFVINRCTRNKYYTNLTRNLTANIQQDLFITKCTKTNLIKYQILYFFTWTV